MTRRLFFMLALLGLATGAVVLRTSSLAARPMHGDEAVQAFRFADLLERGRFRYDPREYHGPTLPYATLPSAWLAGARERADLTEPMLRIVPALFGVAIVLLVASLRRGLGNGAALYAAGLVAASPSLVYYARDFIHETLLVFFLLGGIAAGFRYVTSGGLVAAGLAGAFFGLALATKETSWLGIGAAGIAGAAAAWPALRSGSLGRVARAGGVAALAGVSVAAVLFSMFFRDPAGMLEPFRSIPAYLGRATDGGLHAHATDYYLAVLLAPKTPGGAIGSEVWILALALVGLGVAARGRGLGRADVRVVRFVALFTVLLGGLYAVLPYKTPWNVLGFVVGASLLAGVGASALIRAVRRPRLRAALFVLLALPVVHLAAEAHQASGRFASDARNPYAYAQAVPDVVRLGERIERLAGLHPDGAGMLVRVVSEDPWPLPWYLRRLACVGYWEDPGDAGDAPVVVADAPWATAIAATLQDAYATSYFGLRPGATMVLFVEKGLWDRFRATVGEEGAPTGEARRR